MIESGKKFVIATKAHALSHGSFESTPTSFEIPLMG